MSSTALLLNADFNPLRPIPWERAILLVLEGKAEMVANYAGRMIRSAREAFPWPAVVRLFRQERFRSRIKFSRANILARDGYRCLYCGHRPRGRDGLPAIDDLTYDHVVPRAQARHGKVRLPWNGKEVDVSCWENAATACYRCNTEKGARTPAQAGMKLQSLPRKPSPVEAFRMGMVRVRIPSEWQDFLPADSGWRDYWEGELDGG